MASSMPNIIVLIKIMCKFLSALIHNPVEIAFQIYAAALFKMFVEV